MKIHFDKNLAIELYLHATKCKEFRHTFSEDAPTEPGLILVGDQGVYLMSNGHPHYPHPDNKEHSKVAYALECDPTNSEFSDWHYMKKAIFGGDDGTETIEKAFFENMVRAAKDSQYVAIELTPTQIKVAVPDKSPEV